MVIIKCMENVHEITTRLQRLGYADIHEYDDLAHEEFPDHAHDGDQLLVVVRGDMEVTMDGQVSKLMPNDEMYFPAKKVHSAKVGADGCLYLVGEKK